MSKSKSNSFFKKTGPSSDVLENIKTGYSRNSDMELIYRGKNFNVGEFWTVRILSLHEDHVRQLIGRKAAIANPTKRNEMMEIVVMDPGPEHNGRLVDHEGTPLKKLEQIPIIRIPVWVYSHTDSNKKLREINELRFVECTSGLVKSLKALKESPELEDFYDEDTNRPEFDLRLCIVENNSQYPKKYEFKAVTMGKGRAADPHFGVSADEVLEEYTDDISEAWDTLMEEMEFGTDLKFIEDQLHTRDSDSKPSAQKKRSVASKVEDDENDDDDDEEEEDDDDDEEDDDEEDDDDEEEGRLAKKKSKSLSTRAKQTSAFKRRR